MCQILKIRQNTASHSASAEYSAKLPNIRLRQPAEDYSVHPYRILIEKYSSAKIDTGFTGRICHHDRIFRVTKS